MANLTKTYIDIIIPSKDRDDKLQKCLYSLFKHLTIDNNLYVYNVIIIREHLSKKIDKSFFDIINHPNFRNLNISYIVVKKSIGFTKAINLGIKKSLSKRHKPDYIAFLHDDTIIFNHWIENLLDPLKNNVNVYGSGSTTVNEEDEQCMSKIHGLFGISDFQFNLNEYRPLEENDGINVEDKVKNLTYYIFKDSDKKSGKISLFSAMFRRDAFEKFGLFDENLISSFRVEDEFCQRLIENNKLIAISPKAFVSHECWSLSVLNDNVYEDKLLRDATLYNIELKNNIKKQFNKKVNKNVVYTYLTCEDTQKLNKNFEYHDNSNTDYYCFSERPSFQSSKWKSISIEPFLKLKMFNNKLYKFKEFVKLHPHYFFEKYKISMWVDFDKVNMIPMDVNTLTSLLDKDVFTLTLESKDYTCSWKYLIDQFRNKHLINLHNNVLKLITNTDDPENTVLTSYRFYHFPRELGFMDTSLLIRQHNDEKCIKMMEKIWYNYLNIAPNDMLWFNFIYWLNKENYYSIPFNLYNVEMNKTLSKIIELLKKEQSTII